MSTRPTVRGTKLQLVNGPGSMPFDERSMHAQAPLLATSSSSFLQMVLSLVSRIAAVVTANAVVLGFGFGCYQFNFDHGGNISVSYPRALSIQASGQLTSWFEINNAGRGEVCLCCACNVFYLSVSEKWKIYRVGMTSRFQFPAFSLLIVGREHECEMYNLD